MLICYLKIVINLDFDHICHYFKVMYLNKFCQRKTNMYKFPESHNKVNLIHLCANTY